MEATDEKRPVERPGWSAARLAWAASVAALLVVGAMVIRNMPGETQEPVRFDTATTPDAASQLDYVVTIQFENGVSLETKAELFNEIGALEVTPADDAATYRVVISLPATSIRELERYTQEIESKDGIRTISVIALQLPVGQE